MRPTAPGFRAALRIVWLLLGVLAFCAPAKAQAQADQPSTSKAESLPAHWPSSCSDPAPAAVLRQPRDAPRFRLPELLYHPSAVWHWNLDEVLATETAKNRLRTQHRGGLFPPALQGPSDTLYLYRINKALIRSGADTIRLEEHYRRNRYWTLDRFRRVGGTGSAGSGAWDAIGSQWRFNPEGQPIEELWCEAGDKHCRLWRRIAYWPSGVPAREGAFVEGTPTGLHRAWYPDGQLRACLEYADGRLLAVYGLYGPSGEALPIGSFADGNGTVIRYALTGAPMGENRFKQGKRRGYQAYK